MMYKTPEPGLIRFGFVCMFVTIIYFFLSCQGHSQEFTKGGDKPEGMGDGSPQWGNPKEHQRHRDRN